MRLSRISELFWLRSASSAEAKLEADSADRDLNNSDILRKPNSMILLLFILQQKRSSQQKLLSKQNNFTKFPRSFAIHAKYRWINTQAPTDTRFISQIYMQIRTRLRFIMSAPRHGKLFVGFQPIRLRENNTMNNIHKVVTNMHVCKDFLFYRNIVYFHLIELYESIYTCRLQLPPKVFGNEYSNLAFLTQKYPQKQKKNGKELFGDLVTVRESLPPTPE